MSRSVNKTLIDKRQLGVLLLIIQSRINEEFHCLRVGNSRFTRRFTAPVALPNILSAKQEKVASSSSNSGTILSRSLVQVILSILIRLSSFDPATRGIPLLWTVISCVLRAHLIGEISGGFAITSQMYSSDSPGDRYMSIRG